VGNTKGAIASGRTNPPRDLYPSTFVISEGLPNSTNWNNKRSLVTGHLLRKWDNGNSSSVLNSVPLVSGDNSSSDFGYYRTEIVTLGLRTLGVSRGLPGRIPIV